MGFLAEFDALDGPSANELLYDWILNRREELFEELRSCRPILRFRSLHPGNPDRSDPGEREAGDAYLLTRRADVKHALSDFSMRPYRLHERFVLSNDDAEDHRVKRAALEEALRTPMLERGMSQAVDEAWTDALARSATPGRLSLDLRRFGREVALRFTAHQMGLPLSSVFPSPPDQGLRDWSARGYDHFIWKIHARHFVKDMPNPDGCLEKIAALVAAQARAPREGTVIQRLVSAPGPFSEEDIVANVVGSIQGTVDNVMTGACYALDQMIRSGTLALARGLVRSGDATSLIPLLHEAHRRDTPSPFLPRHGRLSALPSACESPGSLGELHEGRAVNFSCAIGAALDDPRADPDTDEGAWDLRMGYGRHRCVGRRIGDLLMARIIARVIALDDISIEHPLDKRWGWIVDRFVIGGRPRHPSKEERSRHAVLRLTAKSSHRPYALSLWSPSPDTGTTDDYTSWPSLVDRAYSGRHLPPRESSNTLPRDHDRHAASEGYGAVTELFRRPPDGFVPSRSSMLFPYFAQWFTDSFLRVHPADRRRNTSNHDIDMCQLYGLDESTTRLLRKLDGSGKLKSQLDDDGAEYLPALFDEGGAVKAEFWQLPYVRNGHYRQVLDRFDNAEERTGHYFATGLERGNSTFGYTAISTLFLREHNRLCEVLSETYRDWDDERLFQTARLILICLELKIVIEEYINHIAGRPGDGDGHPERPFVFDNGFADTQSWHRSNRITLEFDLLYRWHSLIPGSYRVNGRDYTPDEFRVDNRALMEHGLGAILSGASGQRAGRITLFNTADFLLPAEHAALKMSRDFRLRSYNDYREAFGIPRKRSIAELTSCPRVREALETLYGQVNDVEFLVGLYAEEPAEGKLFGALMTKMVGYDAFTHALTNPLLSRHLFNEETLTPYGLELIADTASLDDIWKRNGGEADAARITMDYTDPAGC